MKAFHGRQVLLGMGLLLLKLHSAAAQTCSDGTPGVESASGTTCCSPGCGVCGGPDCPSIGNALGLDASDCCGTRIQEEGLMCSDTGAAPCVLTLTPPDTTCSDGTPGVESASGSTCCSPGCGVCGGPDCPSSGKRFGLDASDCCGGDIEAAGLLCSDTGEAPCLLSPPASTCSDGTPGVESTSGTVCCTTGCTKCGGSGCSTAGSAAGLDGSDCCGTQIAETGVLCADSGEAPCLLEPAPPSGICSDDLTAGVDGNKRICCTLGCGVCGGPECVDNASKAGLTEDDCCGNRIWESEVYCWENGNVAPCILVRPTPAPTTRFTMAPTTAEVV